jgi:hypothetical protein
VVFDTTLGGAIATSYLTVAEGDAYAAATLGPEAKAWEDATVEEREKALMQATTAVDTFQRSRSGYAVPYALDQALFFPRDIDVPGPYLIPVVKRATWVQAAWLLKNVNLLAEAASHVAAGVFSQSDGDGSWTAAADPTRGLYSPEMVVLLESVAPASRTRGARLISVPMASSFPP